MAVVRLDGIGKSYGGGAAVLSEISLTLEAGDFCFVTGASGAGKTTLLNIIALAEEPTSGRLTLFDTEIAAADRKTRAALRRRIGVVFEGLRLLDHLSAADNVGVPLRIAGMLDAEIREHVAEVADWLGIGERIALFPAALSPSERRRVALARAVVSRPDLLLADEPLSRVDDETAALLMRAFEQLNRVGTTVLIAAPDSDLVRRSPHPRLHLEAGRWAGPENSAKSGPESRPEGRLTS